MALLASVLALAACSGDAGSNPLERPGAEDSAAPTSTTAATTGTTTTTPPEAAVFEEIIAASEAAVSQAPQSSIATPDFVAADAITAELAADGSDLTGVEVWVLPVVAGEERLLVLEIDPSATQLADDDTEALLTALVGLDAVSEAGITRFVINYHDSDEQGEFVLTATLPYDELVRSVAEGADVGDSVQIQLVRVPGSAPTPAPTTLPPGPTALIDESFDDGTTVAASLFGPGVQSTTVVDGVLEMVVFSEGVVPAMYPDPIPDGVEISFDFFPVPTSNGSFGVLVLSEDPADNVLDHYIAVWASPLDQVLTFAPLDNASGGWGAFVTSPIPTGAGFTASAWNTMTLVLENGSVAVSINGVEVATYTGPTPVTDGWFGPVIAGQPGDAMQIDNVLVTEVGQ
jgi:hypothetical protein